MIKQSIRGNYDLEKINYEVIFSNRKTMEIAVYPDYRVIVKAPMGSSALEIETRLLKRSRWIRKKLNFFHQFEPRTPARYYLSGETHLYLGRQYRLKVLIGECNKVKLNQGYFCITCKDENSPTSVKKMMEKWYRQKARERFAETLNRCQLRFKNADFSSLKLIVKKMRTRWGSMSRKGILTLNVGLMRAPKECIDYVIIHELCHMFYRKHGRDFYRLLERLVPDWKIKKQRLEIISI